MALSRRHFLASGLAAAAAPAFGAQPSRNIGEVRIDVDTATVPVRVSGTTPDLQALALTAFRAHGRYRLVSSGQAFDL